MIRVFKISFNRTYILYTRLLSDVTTDATHKISSKGVKFSKSNSFRDPIATAIQNTVHEPQKVAIPSSNRNLRHEKNLMSAYLNVCIDTDQLDRASNLLIKLGSPNQRGDLIDVSHFNIVLKGWSRAGSIKKITETRKHMERRGIDLNAESYAHILLALAKDHTYKREYTNKIYNSIALSGIDVESIFQATYLNPSERALVKDLLKTFKPDFQEKFHDDSTDYDCKLLSDLDQVEPVPLELICPNNYSDLEKWADKQELIENKSSISIKSVANCSSSAEKIKRYGHVWKRLREMWKSDLTISLDKAMEELKIQSIDCSKIHLYPFLCAVDKTMLIDMMLDEIELNATNCSYSFSTNSLYTGFGRRIMLRYLRSKSIRDGSYHEKRNIFTQYLREYCTDPVTIAKIAPRQFIQMKAASTFNYAPYKDRLSSVDEWPIHICSSVGKFLYGLILREVKFDTKDSKNPKDLKNIQELSVTDNLVNAFHTAYIQMDGSYKIKEEFRAHSKFERLHHLASMSKLTFDYSYLPSQCPPFPWISSRVGGYITNISELVRSQNPVATQISLTIPEVDNRKLHPVFDSLNSLGVTAWIVNKEILDLAIEQFRGGGNVDIGLPLDESKMEEKKPVLKPNPTKAEQLIFSRDKKKYDQKRREMYSLWRDCLYRLSIANYFRDATVWYPHNVDFRGRTYPIPPHFNHLGADLARSLLLFAKGRPLGEKGLDWLKIHLVNLVGNMKKSTLKERLDYANSILHVEVLDSADNPWDGRRWWAQNDCPWQVLACCKEIAKAIRSRDHTAYNSHFPIHQDGSCNGLQHYAALGRDYDGGKSVNLVPSERPQDVYSRVVEIVETHRKKDAEDGVEVAKMLEGVVDRKVIKQTVMTTVYGVTRFGARLQIARQLEDKSYDEKRIWRAAQYLVNKTFDSIGQMFNSSRAIQDWIVKCAHLIASKCHQPVSWETPLGFLVVQPYTHNRVSSAKYLAPSLMISRPVVQQNAILNAYKQRSAFPPNYIHSLDSSHMMLTSLLCHRLGITFVSVHDCFWTHPSTVDEMNVICRKQFIKLHQEPLLEDLANQFKTQHAAHLRALSSDVKLISSRRKLKDKILASDTPELRKEPRNMPTLMGKLDADIKPDLLNNIPKQGNLDIHVIMNSTYFFS